MHNYKWGKLLKNFLNSDKEILRLTDSISLESLIHSIRYNAKGKVPEIGYMKRGDSVYIYKKNIPITDMEDAINGNY